jgi:hypothetical protein
LELLRADGTLTNTPGYLWPRWLFLRALGLIFLSAFYSFAFQIHGLIGEHSVLPSDTLTLIHREAGICENVRGALLHLRHHARRRRCTL